MFRAYWHLYCPSGGHGTIRQTQHTQSEIVAFPSRAVLLSTADGLHKFRRSKHTRFERGVAHGFWTAHARESEKSGMGARRVRTARAPRCNRLPRHCKRGLNGVPWRTSQEI